MFLIFGIYLDTCILYGGSVEIVTRISLYKRLILALDNILDITVIVRVDNEYAVVIFRER